MQQDLEARRQGKGRGEGLGEERAGGVYKGKPEIDLDLVDRENPKHTHWALPGRVGCL